MEHRTKDGIVIEIAAMDDDHLLNTIYMFCKKIIPLTKRISEEPQARDRRQRARYGTTTLSLNSYAEIMEEFEEAIAPYIMEAALRNIMNIDHRGNSAHELLCVAIGRKTRETALPSHNELATLQKQMDLNDEMSDDLDDEDMDYLIEQHF